MSSVIGNWLAYAHAFESNDIGMDLLSEVDDQTLKDIGILSAGHRLRIHAAIAKLGSQGDTGAVENPAGITIPAPAAAAGRRLVTALIAELAGSTASDPAQMRAAMAAFRPCVGETAQRFGGLAAKHPGRQRSCLFRLSAVA